ncbi:hypothetical protein [Rubritalea tangerina]|uniref:Uncharacterized protein n=1 Tax=Rubritalea tangerina TaxID=430798 RepID=A0ABW4Z7W2_9BACT
MKNKIENALSKLVGKNMVASGYAGLQWFLFGEKKVVIAHDGKKKENAEYSLNVSTSWRIRGANGVVTGSQDYFHPPGDINEDFDYDSFNPVEEENRTEAALKGLFNTGEMHTINRISGDECGSLFISFESGYVLEVIPMDSVDQEHWRFFAYESSEAHFVITGTGVEE